MNILKNSNRCLSFYFLMLLIVFSLSGCKKDKSMEAENGTIIEIDDEKLTTAVAEEIQTQESIKVNQAQASVESTDEDGGGNEFATETEKTIVYKILVLNSEYIFDNKVVELEDFIEIVKNTKGKVIVEISENEATQRAYKNLYDELEELEVFIKEN